MKSKQLILLVTILTIFLLLSGTASAANEINTLDDLKNIGDTGYDPAWSMTADYKLMKNISISEGTWLSIGNFSNPFKGTFDGNGKTITFTEDTTFTKSGGSYYSGYGLFGNIDGAELKNIKIVAGGNLTDGNKFYFGALVGNASGSSTITNCSVKVNDGFSIIGGNDIGGLAGSFNGTISKSYVLGNVNGSGSNVSGLAGSFGGTLSESYIIGDVSGDTNVSGLVGFTLSCNISESYGVGNVSGGTSVGGLIGDLNVGGNISESYFIGNVTGSSHTGGLVGLTFGSGNISQSYFTGTASGNSYVGGLVGKSRAGNISESFAAGSANGNNDYVGGLVGSFENGNISESYAVFDIIGNSNVGGLAGYLSNSNISESYASGLISSAGGNIGGIIGLFSTGSVTDCFYIADNVVGTNAYGIGVSNAELKQIATFTDPSLAGGGWSISSSPDQDSIWYINEGKDYPKFYWQYEPPAPNGGGGSGTGNATVVDPSDNNVQKNDSVPLQNDSGSFGAGSGYGGFEQDSPIEEDEAEESGSKRFPWLLLLILLLIVVGSILYFANKNGLLKRSENS